MKELKQAAIFTALACASQLSLAYTECPPALVNRVWVDNGGSAEVGLNSGVVVLVYAGIPGSRQLVSQATAAMLAGKYVIIRFNADGVSCTGGNRDDWWGMHTLG